MSDHFRIHYTLEAIEECTAESLEDVWKTLKLRNVPIESVKSISKNGEIVYTRYPNQTNFNMRESDCD